VPPAGGLRVLVLDANAFISGVRVERFKAERVVTTGEALAEVRDRSAVQNLELASALADIVSREPTAASLKEGESPGV
jgi:rRNA maturation endonuclease Nob1